MPPTSSSSSSSSSGQPNESAMEPGSDTLAPMNNATSMGNNNNNNHNHNNNNNMMLPGVLEIQRIDVKDTTISINGLKKDVLYELVVKAGNTYGA